MPLSCVCVSTDPTLSTMDWIASGTLRRYQITPVLGWTNHPHKFHLRHDLPRKPCVSLVYQCNLRKPNVYADPTAFGVYGAPGRTRTNTPLREPDFESGASTNSATGARLRTRDLKRRAASGSTPVHKCRNSEGAGPRRAQAWSRVPEVTRLRYTPRAARSTPSSRRCGSRAARPSRSRSGGS
jgi:hypothetical protein